MLNSGLKVLVTGIGGPGGIAVAQSLKMACGKHHLIGVDCDPYAPGQVIVDEFYTIPPAANKNFIPAILEITEKCDALFCVVDEELPEISNSIRKFNCKVFVASSRAVSLSLDKFETFKVLKKAGIPVPHTVTYETGVVGFPETFNPPFIVKPRRGRGSRNIFKVTNRKEMEAARCLVPGQDMIIQEYVEGPEYTVDVLVNEESELVACVPRERVRVRNGLTMVGRTVKNDRFVELAGKIAKTLGLKYIFNFQCKGDLEFKVIEVNSRPSGTLILSTMAGVNMPEILLEDKLKPKAYLNNYKENVWLFRTLSNYIIERK